MLQHALKTRAYVDSSLAKPSTTVLSCSNERAYALKRYRSCAHTSRIVGNSWKNTLYSKGRCREPLSNAKTSVPIKRSDRITFHYPVAWLVTSQSGGVDAF